MTEEMFLDALGGLVAEIGTVDGLEDEDRSEMEQFCNSMKDDFFSSLMQEME